MNETYPFNSEETDGMGQREQLEEYFSQSLEVDTLLRLCPDDEDTIYQIVELLVDTCATNRKMLRIAGDDKPAEVVRSRFMKLNADHIRFVLTCLAENSSPIRNMKQYLLASLYNAPTTMQLVYQNTQLENKGLEVVIREELTDDQWQRYQIFQDTLGGRPYLFNGGLPPGGSDGSGEAGIDYTIPAEALTDEEFSKIYKEAQKYVGTPYVWGGSTPETGFDCSGYVCGVYNQAGYDVGRTTANGLWNKCQHISEAEAKPGDLVFFSGTYDTPGMSHCGIYLGNGMMVSAGDPIKYANIHSSYWQKYLAGFGRLSK